MLSSVFMLAFFANAYAYTMLMYSEKYTNAIHVTIISSTEPVMTFLLALLIPNSVGQTENFRLSSMVGAVCITLGAVIAGMDFLASGRGRTAKREKESAA